MDDCSVTSVLKLAIERCLKRSTIMCLTGGCHCRSIQYEAAGEPIAHGLCHCQDCRLSAGAPVVGWVLFPDSAVRVVKGAPSVFSSSGNGRRHFCASCGTGVFYTNEKMLPGIIDVRSATLDEPEKLPAQFHMQTADRIDWMKAAHTLPEYEGFPPAED